MADYPMKRPSDFETRNPEQVQLYTEDALRSGDALEGLRQASMVPMEKIVDKATNFTGKEMPFDDIKPKDFLEHLVKRARDPNYNKGASTLDDIGRRTQDKQEQLAAMALMKDKELGNPRQLMDYLFAQENKMPPNLKLSTNPSDELNKLYPGTNLPVEGFYHQPSHTLYAKPGDSGTVAHESKHAIDEDPEGGIGAGEVLNTYPNFAIENPSQAGIAYEAGHFKNPVDSVSLGLFKKLREQLSKEPSNPEDSRLP